LGVGWKKDATEGFCSDEAVVGKAILVNLVVISVKEVKLAAAVDVCTVDWRLIRVKDNAGFLSIAQVPVATCPPPMELFSEQVESAGLYTRAAQSAVVVHRCTH
jgi:hypothetical protein